MKILLLQLKRIGDLILTTPAIAALRERFPEAEVTIVVSSECADLLPAITGVDHILIARRNLSDLAAFLAVAGNKFDYCIDFTRNDRSAFLAFLSGARKRIVSYRVRDQSKSRARLYTDFVNVRMRDLHTIDYNLSLLKPLGIGDVSSSLAFAVAAIGARKSRRASTQLERQQTLYCFASRFGARGKALGSRAMGASNRAVQPGQ